MKSTLAFAAVFAAAMTVGAAAQYGNPPSSASKDKDARDLTVTGCLTSGDVGTTGTTGSTTASSAKSAGAGQYFLTNASFATGAPSSTTPPDPTSTTPPETPPSPTAGTTGTSASDQTRIRLVGEKDKLAALVNHQVEIKGRWEKDSSSTTTTAPTTTPPTPPAASEMASGMGRAFHVSSLKDIASTCTAK